MPTRLLAASLVSAALAATGCVNDLGADEDEPYDDRGNVAEQGLYDCSQSNATGYSSGSSFSIKVVHVDGKAVELHTANAYIAMQKNAQQSGVSLRVVSGFRTMAEQQYLYGCYVNGNCNGGNLAAVPGYSNHQSGHAMDLNTSDPGVYSWLSNHGSHFGWSRTVPSEIWHWEWWGHAADYPGPCGLPPVPPHCASGHFDGAFCDDDGHADEGDHDRLHDELGVDFHCGSMNGHPAYCGGDDVNRSQAIFVLGKAAHMPTSGHPDAFVDDDSDAHEKYFDAAKAYGILLGFGGRHVKPTMKATRDQLATMLVRMYKLQPASHDYFYDDDGDANEANHNKVAAAGLIVGYADAHHTRRKFLGGSNATRDTLAVVALRAHDHALVPVWNIPQPCLSGQFDGSFCDDDGRGDEAAIESLVGELGVSWSCGDLAGRPAFCPGEKVSRAEAMYALGKAAGMPLSSSDPDGFTDDDGHRRERWLNAAKVWGILLGYDGGAHVRPNRIANRDTLAVMLARMYALPDPPPGTPDAFSDDDGTANERWHDKVAYAGLFTGYGDGHGGRSFKGGNDADKATVALLAVRAKDHGLVPVWAQPTTSPAPAPSVDDASADPPPSDTPVDVPPDDASVDDPNLDDPAVDDPAEDGSDADIGPSPDGAVEGAPPGLGPPPAVSGGCSAAGVDGAGLGALALAGLLAPRRRRPG